MFLLNKVRRPAKVLFPSQGGNDTLIWPHLGPL